MDGIPRQSMLDIPGRAPHSQIVQYMLLLDMEPYKGGEHALDLLIVSVSMSMSILCTSPRR